MEQGYKKYDHLTLRGFNAPITAHDTEQFNAGLSQSVAEQYLQSRDTPGKPVPYVAPPESEKREFNCASDALVQLVKPIGLLSAMAAGVYFLASVAIGFATATVSAVSVWCAANTGLVTGVVFGVVALACALSGWSSGASAGNDAGPGPGPGGAQNINVVVNVNSGNGTK